MVNEVHKGVEHYIWGLVPEIKSMVTASNPTTIQQAIQLAHKLTDQAVEQGRLPKRGAVASVPDNKRKWDSANNTKSSSSSSSGQPQPQQQEQPVQQQRRFDNNRNFNQTAANNQGPSGYGGRNPKCTRCNYHHVGRCDNFKCQRCGKIGHAAKDCRSELVRRP